MIRRALLTVLLCCSMLAVHAASPALPTPAVTSAASVPVVIGESRVLQSAVLDEQRRYSVALPPGYAWSPDRRFPVLQTYTSREAPQLPYGYPLMTMAAMVPPLWKRIMNRRVKAWRRQHYADIKDWHPYNKALNPVSH